MFTDIEMTMMNDLPPHEFLRLLYEKIGEEGFGDSKKLNAYISDLMVDSNGVKQRIRYAIKSNIQQYVLREPRKQIEKTRFMQIVVIVKEQTGMSSEAAEEFVGLFSYATGRIMSYPFSKVYYPSLRPVKVNGKYGYADENNSVVIKPKYDRAKPFSNERAKVCIKSKYGFIDRSGYEVINIIYDKADDFTGKSTEVVLNGSKIVIDLDGNVIK